jgi:hypothetical protein
MQKVTPKSHEQLSPKLLIVNNLEPMAGIGPFFKRLRIKSD